MTDADDLAKLRPFRMIIPEVIVGDATPPEKLAQLRAAGFTLKI